MGIAFHVGSLSSDIKAYYYAIKDARTAYDLCISNGFDIKVVDIGGGYPGGGDIFEKMVENINEGMDKYFPIENYKHIEFISEPGRFLCEKSTVIASKIISKRTNDGSYNTMYYLNDGVYGSFLNVLIDEEISYPDFLIKNEENGEFEHYTSEDLDVSKFTEKSIWGPTCDSLDVITEASLLPDLNVGEWMLFENMGAYSRVFQCNFNGMLNYEVCYLKPDVYPPTFESSSNYFENKVKH